MLSLIERITNRIGVSTPQNHVLTEPLLRSRTPEGGPSVTGSTVPLGRDRTTKDVDAVDRWLQTALAQSSEDEAYFNEATLKAKQHLLESYGYRLVERSKTCEGLWTFRHADDSAVTWRIGNERKPNDRLTTVLRATGRPPSMSEYEFYDLKFLLGAITR